MSLLPSQEVCEQLCKVFFTTVFPLIPILHLPSFAEDFQEFWKERNVQPQHPTAAPDFLRKKPGFVSLLSSMLFASLVSASREQLKAAVGISSELQAGDMYFVTIMAASLTGFPRRPSLYTLAGYIYAQSQFVREEEFSDSPEFINTAFRVALGMGLHRNLDEAGFTVAESETRRRLWWYVLHLDVMSSCSSGLSPLFVDEKMGNCGPISLSDQLDNGGNGEMESEFDFLSLGNCLLTEVVDVRYLVAETRYETTRIIRGILLGHFEDAYTSQAKVTDTVHNLEELAKKIKSTIERILKIGSRLSRRQLNDMYQSENNLDSTTASSRFDSVWKVVQNESRESVVKFAAWAASLLHLMLHKAYCVLYYPLAKDPNTEIGMDIRPK